MDILQNFLTTGFFYTIIRVSTPLIFARDRKSVV